MIKLKKIKLFILFILIGTLILSIFSCKHAENFKEITESEYFEMPDKIITYNEANSRIIEKDSKLYNAILYLMDKRLKEVRNFEIYGYLLMDEDIEIKNNSAAVEFIYDNEKQTIYGKEIKNYFRILFPLTSLPDSVEDELIFFGDNKHYYSPAIKVPEPDNELINLIIEEVIFKK